MTQAFKSPWWCQGAHFQTILGTLLRFPPCCQTERVCFDTPDGDYLHLDLMVQPDKYSKQPILFILHGLEGSSKASYVQTLASEAYGLRWDVVLINQRMCSGFPNRLASTYHSGKTEDLESIIHHFRKRFPDRPFYAAGFSIGGNILLKWLGEQGKNAGLEKAVAISVPYDLAQSVQLLDRGFNRHVYTRLMLSSLKRKVRLKAKLWPDAYPVEGVLKSSTFTEFDRLVTAPLNGFKDEIDYWKKSSSCFYLKHIETSTLLIHADDDPFFPGDYLPLEEINKSSAIRILRVCQGGHLGFMSGSLPWKQDRWLEKTVINFFSESLPRPKKTEPSSNHA